MTKLLIINRLVGGSGTANCNGDVQKLIVRM
jgi:hypothetical protein